MDISRIAFLCLLAGVGAGRLIELRISQRNQRRMLERGAQLVPDMSFGWMVLWHGGILVSAAIEVVVLARPFLPELAVPMLLVFIFANFLRWWVIRALAEHWNVQVMNSAGLGVVTRGPYRWIRHPNYVAVFLEMVALPLIHTGWITVVAAAASTVAVLARRLSVEEAVLLESPVYREAMASKPRFVPGLF
jgi:methyltransferase